jgi:hypothetical protein
VPVHACGRDIVTIRTAHLLSGERVGLGFTSPETLAAVLGTEQRWIIVHADALRDLLAPRRISRILVDPDIAVAPLDRENGLCRARIPRLCLTCWSTPGARAHPRHLLAHGPGVRLAGAPGTE